MRIGCSPTCFPSTRGVTICDRHGRLGREPNALVATTLDADAFWALIVDALAALGR